MTLKLPPRETCGCGYMDNGIKRICARPPLHTGECGPRRHGEP
jgi:hypothetical protein